jgi:hypothetical protein
VLRAPNVGRSPLCSMRCTGATSRARRLQLPRKGASLRAEPGGARRQRRIAGCSRTASSMSVPSRSSSPPHALALLVHDGAVNVDQPVDTWIPELPSWASKATLTHLLHHTSGIPTDLEPRDDDPHAGPAPALSTEDLFQVVCSAPHCLFSPASDMSTAGTATTFLELSSRAPRERPCATSQVIASSSPSA